MSDLVWQDAWAGQHLYNTGALICRDRCYDIPNEQLRTIILPPDPPPVLNARVPDFAYEEQIVLIAQRGVHQSAAPSANLMETEDDEVMVTEGGISMADEEDLVVNEFSQLPPWGAGPQLILCDQGGEIALIAQYLNSV